MSEHEHEDEECEVQQVAYALPQWRWSTWDLAGIALTTVGGFFGVLNQGLNLISRECSAAANFSRHEYEQARLAEEREAAVAAYQESQRQMAAELQALVEGPEEMVFDETGGEDED